MYDPPRGEAFTLNRSARAVWSLCDGSRTIREIANELAEWLQSPADEILCDVRTSVQALDGLGLLESDIAGRRDDPE